MSTRGPFPAIVNTPTVFSGLDCTQEEQIKASYLPTSYRTNKWTTIWHPSEVASLSLHVPAGSWFVLYHLYIVMAQTTTNFHLNLNYPGSYCRIPTIICQLQVIDHTIFVKHGGNRFLSSKYPLKVLRFQTLRVCSNRISKIVNPQFLWGLDCKDTINADQLRYLSWIWNRWIHLDEQSNWSHMLTGDSITHLFVIFRVLP